MTAALYIVDVFAERRFAGNPLAVIVGTEELADESMQAVAAEMNGSETTFVRSAPRPDGAWPVRIFTPAREIEFAGHPILGTAWVIREHLAPGVGASVRLQLAVGPVAVSFEPVDGGAEVVWFAAPQITLGGTCDAERIAAALGLSVQDIETAAPIRQVSAGTSVLIVPLRSLGALRRSRLDLAAFASLAREGFAPRVYLFCRETRNPRNDLSARFFFDAHGVREDPATGNGAAFLGAYLLEHRLFGASELSLCIEQGDEVRRPSLVMLRARKAGGSLEVSVGGHVIPTVRGELL